MLHHRITRSIRLAVLTFASTLDTLLVPLSVCLPVCLSGCGTAAHVGTAKHPQPMPRPISDMSPGVCAVERMLPPKMKVTSVSTMVRHRPS